MRSAEIRRGFLNSWTWQPQNRSYFARLPQFFKLTTLQNKAILWDLLQTWKVECRAEGPVPVRFAMFPLHLYKLLRLPWESDARSYEVLHLSHKTILANLKIWCSKMHPLSGNQRPDLLTSLMNMSLVLPLPRDMHLCKTSSHAQRLPLLLESLRSPHLVLTFGKVQNPLRLPQNHIWNSKTQTCGVVNTCLANVLRATTARTSSTSQLPKAVRRCLVSCIFWLRNVRCATTACTFYTFSISRLPKVVRRWGAV